MASTTTPRSSAVRSTTGWSPTARCRPGTPRTTAWAWSTAAPSWSKPSPTGRARRRTGSSAAPTARRSRPAWSPAAYAEDVTDLEVLRLGLVDYQEAWDRQREIHARVVEGTAPDTLLLLEHPPVYTAGKRTLPHERPFDGTPVIDVDRGGKITWHGPGQLVGYPIGRRPDPVDVGAHVRRLEHALMEVCAGLGVATERVEGRSGVWVRADEPERGHRPDRTVAAIGVRVAKGVSMPGFALNCAPDMTPFANMIPCGIVDAGATSLTAELGRDVAGAEVIDPAEAALARALAFEPAA